MSEKQYDERPTAMASKCTHNTVQPLVLAVDTWRVFGFGLSRSGEIVQHFVQASLYHTCCGTSGDATLALQGTILLQSHGAIALGLELMSQGHIVESGVGGKDLSEEAQALVAKRILQLQQELKDLQAAETAE